MPTAKELNLKIGDVVEMHGFGFPRRYSDSAIGLYMENVKIEVVNVDDEYRNVTVKYLEKSKLAGTEEGDISRVTNPQYCGFYRPKSKSNV